MMQGQKISVCILIHPSYKYFINISCEPSLTELLMSSMQPNSSHQSEPSHLVRAIASDDIEVQPINSGPSNRVSQ